MLPCWPVQQSLGYCGHDGGPTNQWLQYFGKYLSQSVVNRSTAGHYRPEGCAQLVNLGEPIEFGGTTTHGIHSYICVTI